MCLHDRYDILRVLPLAENRRGPGHGAEWRRSRTLVAGVHVTYVVIADVDEVITSLSGTAQRLDSDVMGAAISSHGHHGEVLPAHGPQASHQPGGRCCH